MTNDCQTDVSITFVDEGLVHTNFCVVHAVNYAQLRESLAAGVVDISYLTNDGNVDGEENSDADEDEGSNGSEESELGSSDSNEGCTSSSEEHEEIEYESDESEDQLESSDSEAEVEKRFRSAKQGRRGRPRPSTGGVGSRKSVGTGDQIAESSRSGQSTEGKRNAKTKKKTGTKDKRQVLKRNQLSGKELEDLCSSIREKEEELLQLDGCKEHLKSSRSINYFPARKELLDTILLDCHDDNLKQLLTFMYANIEAVFLECGKKKISKKDKKAVFAHHCSQDLLSFSEKTQRHFTVWEDFMRLSGAKRCQEGETVLRSVLYWYVYEKFHEGMLLSKDAKYNVLEQHQVKFKEDDEMLYRFSGSALQRMIKLREETIAGKQGRREATPLSIERMKKELEILYEIRMLPSEKKDLPMAIQLLDEGGLTFFKPDFIPVIREIDNSVREFLNLENANKYPGKILEVTQNAVGSNKNLEKLFKEKLTEIG